MAQETQKISPCLWFNTQAEEAVQLYTSLFKNSSTGTVTRYDKASAEASGQSEGSVLTVDFTLAGQSFMALNGGPAFTFTPATSFIVNCENKEEVDELWGELSEGGEVLMPLDTYPFSERYGWCQDKYGVSWQIMATNPEGDWRPKITPSLLFVGDKAGKAEEAIDDYVSIFKGAERGMTARYEAGQEPDVEGTIMYADFQLEGQWFAAMDSAQEHDFTFSEAISFQVMCDTQEEIDHYWEKLSAVPESEQCGWLKDKYGVSWQIVPKVLPELLADSDKEKAGRAMKAMLGMKKLDIAELKAAAGD